MWDTYQTASLSKHFASSSVTSQKPEICGDGPSAISGSLGVAYAVCRLPTGRQKKMALITIQQV